jgi:predicted nucleic acid-binding protein
MQPALLDTSIYITALRGGNEALLGVRRLAAATPMWLSAVVLEELYAGTNRRDRHIVERLERDFDRVRRILMPNLSDWAQTGRLLAWLGAGFGYEQIGKARLTNDALIAMSAARLGITIITANQRDFARLARFRPFRYEIKAVKQV